MSHAACVSRTAGLAIALGIGAAVVTGWSSGLAWADESGGSPGSAASGTAAGTDQATGRTGASDVEAEPSRAAQGTAKHGDTHTKSSTKKDVEGAAPTGVVVSTGGFKQDDATSTTKTTPLTEAGAAEPDPNDGWARKPRAPKRSSEAEVKHTRTRPSAPVVAVDDTEHDVSAAITGATSRLRNLAADVMARPSAGAVSLRTPSAPSSSAATPSTQLTAASTHEPTPPDALSVVSGVVSRIVHAVLSPFAATSPSGAPAETPSLWSLLAFARREFDTAFQSPSVTDAPAAAQTTSEPLVADPQAAGLQVQAVENSLTYTAPPSFLDQAIVFGVRVLREVSYVVGVNLFVEIGVLTASDNPPFFLTFGLQAQQTDYEVSPGNVWKAWEFQPPNPTGKTVIAVHGGGWTIQPTLLHWIDYTQMARDTGATVVVPIYPLATTEAGSALNVIPGLANFISHEIDVHGADNVSVYGDSAGASMALTAVRELILRGDPVPSSMVVLSGSADLSSTNPDILTIDDPVFDVRTIHSYDIGHWTDGIDDLQDPRLSPLFFESDVLTALPPTTIYVGSLEVVLPDNLLLYQRAVDEGAPISMVVGVGQIHDWPLGGLPTYSQTPIVRPDIYRELGLIPDAV